ncbi:hypothetical protein C8F04DRAFT_230005 [Mycena alexandri]|uniref:Uncharacterized protein n=1 Tax=Mycena alexandri TaxID=1745969 RepID=A0AAD6S802_9AGAR|nr:hypothetical protein C8F04DRAFT_230005 [Mycena alexandri]
MTLCDYLWWKENHEWRIRAYKRAAQNDFGQWFSLEEDEKLSADCAPIVSLATLDRDMLRIIYACKVTAIGTRSGAGDFLLRTRFLLGLSWDELTGVFGSLRGTLGRDIDITRPAKHRTWIVDEKGLAIFHAGSVMADLAKACLWYIRAVIRGQMSGWAFSAIVPTQWGFFLRACPPPGLLDDLLEFMAAPERMPGTIDDFYNLVQCLKMFRPIPVALVNHFEHELEDEDTNDLEEEWTKWCQRCHGYSKWLTIC